MWKACAPSSPHANGRCSKHWRCAPAASPQAELERLVHGFDSEVASNALEVHVSALRRKLGRELIETVRGLGYRIDGGGRLSAPPSIHGRLGGALLLWALVGGAGVAAAFVIACGVAVGSVSAPDAWPPNPSRSCFGRSLRHSGSSSCRAHLGVRRERGARAHHALSFSTDAPKPWLRSFGLTPTECSVHLRLPSRLSANRESTSGLRLDVQAQAGIGCHF